MEWFAQTAEASNDWRKSLVSPMIKKLRTLMDLTQEQFAAKVDVTFATVNRWKAGKAKPSRLAMNRLEELRKSLTDED